MLPEILYLAFMVLVVLEVTPFSEVVFLVVRVCSMTVVTMRTIVFVEVVEVVF